MLGSVGTGFLVDALLDLHVDRVVLVVKVGQLDKSDTGAEDVEVELGQEFLGLVNEEQELVLIVDALQVVDT